MKTQTATQHRSASRRMSIATVLVALASIASPALAQIGINHYNQEKIEFTIDVSEDMNKFVEHRTAVGVEPVRGSQFVTEGNIFPAFTIQGKGEQFDPNMTGSRGTWFCKGVFLVKGSEFDKSPFAVLSDQLYLLPNGGHTVATTGTEGNGLAIRAVTGGTGAFAGYIGEQRQQFLGFNKTGGANLRVTITLRKASK
jgi:hypothetical protein